MSASTPGPWTIEDEGDEYSIVNREHEGDDWCVCTVHEGSLANASLIAAAPDLLEALKVLADIPLEEFGWVKRKDQPITGWNKHMLLVSHVLAARDAIAKATGAA